MSQLMIVSMLIFFGLSVPVAVSIGLASLAGVGAANLPWLVVAQQLYAALDKYPLVAIPFFILAGNLMEAGGISERMVEFAKSVVGGIQATFQNFGMFLIASYVISPLAIAATGAVDGVPYYQGVYVATAVLCLVAAASLFLFPNVRSSVARKIADEQAAAPAERAE